MMRKISIFFHSRPLLFPFLVCAIVLSGCGASRYRADYNGFNAAYADSSNRQMLLNLARLDQHDPTYFLQFGQISVQYQVTSSANVVVNETIPSVAAPKQITSPIATGTGTVGVGAATTPSFTFIPVTDDKVAQQLLLPVQPDVIYTLFQQGWPVDQLLRLMVERFEIQLPGDTKITTYSNSPGRCDAKSYATFLKICAIAREFQIDGHLKLRGTEQFVPLAENWASKDQPAAKDLLDAHDKGYIYQKQSDGAWVIGKNELVPSFVLDGESDATIERLRQNPVYSEGISLENVRTLLSGQGFSVQGKLVGDQDSTGSHLVLRSFLNILAAAAQEQTNFNVTLGHSAWLNHIPESELRPVIRLKWNGDTTPLLPALVAVDYQGESYQVTDPATGKVDEAASWNRDVFRLLTELGTQVSVDISKFPLPTTLQVLQ
ncbi:MAG: hypothetical protein LV480_11815 [Methylacidiphilales bacterium]|nr:hypothetical protein [Candidatus Methylacidiphilales bacterium]